MADWSFAHLSPSETTWGPHGYHRYPAKFIPQLVRRLIDTYSEPTECVADPFLGSATTGVEAILAERRFIGSDVSPVALLISTAKCTPLAPGFIGDQWKNLRRRIVNAPTTGKRSLDDCEKRGIAAIDINHASDEERLGYWFPPAHSAALTYLLERISRLKNPQAITFFLCAFSNILRGCSIWLSGSVKPQKDLSKVLNDPVMSFHRQVEDMLTRNKLYWEELTKLGSKAMRLAEQTRVTSMDARNLKWPTESIDLLVTSPPYATCYEYTEIHQLTQLWLDKFDLLPSFDWRSASIGSKTISNRPIRQDVQQSTGSRIADEALTQLELLAESKGITEARREAKTLRRYFEDMNLFIREGARVVAKNKRMVLVVADSKKRGITIPTSAALRDVARTSGFVLERKVVRAVARRQLVSTRDQLTGRFSSAAVSTDTAYPVEDILIFRRRI